MKKAIAMTIGFPAAIVAAWFAVIDMKNTNLDPVDFEMSAKACEVATIKSVNDFIDYSDYGISVEAYKKAMKVAKDQCKTSVVDGVESQELLLAGRLLADGFDYEEQRTIRYSKEYAKEHAKKFKVMGKNAARLWIERNK